MSAPTVSRPRSHAVTSVTVTFDRIGPIRRRLSVVKPIAPLVILIPPHTARDADALLRYISPVVRLYASGRMDTRPRVTGDVDTTGNGTLHLDGGVSGSATITPT